MVPSPPTPVSRKLTSSALIPRVISAIMVPIIPGASSRCAIAFTVPDLLDAVRDIHGGSKDISVAFSA